MRTTARLSVITISAAAFCAFFAACKASAPSGWTRPGDWQQIAADTKKLEAYRCPKPDRFATMFSFGYSTDLRSMTQGQGTFSMEFCKYKQVPKSIQEKIVEERKAEQLVGAK